MKPQKNGEISWKHGKDIRMLTLDAGTRSGLWRGWNPLIPDGDS